MLPNRTWTPSLPRMTATWWHMFACAPSIPSVPYQLLIVLQPGQRVADILPQSVDSLGTLRVPTFEFPQVPPSYLGKEAGLLPTPKAQPDSPGSLSTPPQCRRHFVQLHSLMPVGMTVQECEVGIPLSIQTPAVMALVKA